jgi:transcription-repair coupling factor (superfamily II helicase)
VQLQFIKNPPIEAARVLAFIQKRDRQARLAGPEKLRVEAKLPTWPERAAAVKDILNQLAA